jgi:uncharacterized RDD family membrane protein YckC
MPRAGRGSIGRFGRRILAIFIDWGLGLLLSWAFFSRSPIMTLVIFLVLQVVFIPTLGGSIGHRLCGLRVAALDGGWVGLWRPLLRTFLLALILPAIVWDSDQRGFHDKVAGTVLYRA